MPFQSQAQWNWAFATGQEWADEWAKMTPGGKRRYELLRKRVSKKISNTPDNPALWKEAVAQAKRRFNVYPSAYANAWATRWYKKRGGTWSTSKEMSHKHLPGKHDQRKHGRDGGGGGGASNSSGTANQEAIAEYRKQNAHIITQFEVMTQAEFDNKVIDLAKQLVLMDETTQMTLATDPEIDSYTGLALMLFGEPSVRDELAQRLQESGKQYYQKYQEVSAQGGKISEIPLPYNKPFSLLQQARQSSLEYMILDLRDMKQSNGQTFSDAEGIWRIHGDGRTGLQTAHIQQIMTEVGPNVEVERSKIKSFFPNGLNPKPNPRFVKAIQDEYDKTQAEMARRGITEIQLYRSSPFTPGIALEPWTPIKQVAQTFSKLYTGMGSKMRSAKIPVRYFIATYETASGWDDSLYIGKSEHMVAGLAYANDRGEI